MAAHATDPAAELASVRREFRVITICVWSVAAIVMIYGAGNVYDLLTDHDVPASIAWMLSPAVDAALCVGLVATGGLTRYGVPAGWVGALRWISALITWGLNVAGPFTHVDKAAGQPGIDWLGVFIHSVGPVLLFVVVEAAAYFQHRMGKVIADLTAKATQAEENRRAERAQLADLRQRLATITADRDTHLRRVERLASEAATVADMEAQMADLRGQMEADQREHSEAVQRLIREHAAEVARVRSEAKTTKLDDYRRGASGGGVGGRGKAPTRTPPKVRLTDEEAVQALLAHDKDPEREWTPTDVVNAIGCGWGRAPKLIALVAEAHLRRSSEAGPRRTSGGASDDAEERAS